MIEVKIDSGGYHVVDGDTILKTFRHLHSANTWASGYIAGARKELTVKRSGRYPTTQEPQAHPKEDQRVVECASPHFYVRNALLALHKLIKSFNFPPLATKMVIDHEDLEAVQFVCDAKDVHGDGAWGPDEASGGDYHVGGIVPNKTVVTFGPEEQVLQAHVLGTESDSLLMDDQPPESETEKELMAERSCESDEGLMPFEQLEPLDDDQGYGEAVYDHQGSCVDCMAEEAAHHNPGCRWEREHIRMSEPTILIAACGCRFKVISLLPAKDHGRLDLDAYCTPHSQERTKYLEEHRNDWPCGCHESHEHTSRGYMH